MTSPPQSRPSPREVFRTSFQDMNEPLLIRVDSLSSRSHTSRTSLTSTNTNSTPRLSNGNINMATRTSPNKKLQNIPRQVLCWIRHHPDALAIGTAIAAWYWIGVLAICTTKLLLSTPLDQGGVPSPLVLTFQQLALGSLWLRVFLAVKRKLCGSGMQPWPVEQQQSTKGRWQLDYLILTGLFNGLDFLASATSFSHSSASFVETIKASEPITTTALALWFGVDTLGSKRETVALTILIGGVLMSTYANATAHHDSAPATTTSSSMQDSIQTLLTVMTANLCFAFRAMAQKFLRKTATGSPQKLDDFNLLYRMQSIGAASLLLPVLCFQHYTVLGIVFGRNDFKTLGYGWGLSLLNAWAIATYCAASCFMLTKLSVAPYSGLNCLRRLFAIVTTSVAFGVPISSMGWMGIHLSILGFMLFSHFRFQRQGQGKKGGSMDAIDHHEKKSDSMDIASSDSLTEASSSSEEEGV